MRPKKTANNNQVLENFVPGYGPIHKFVLLSLGFDVTILVSFGVALYVANKLFNSLFKFIYDLIEQHYTSEINIYSLDEIHSHLISFLARKYETVPSRSLIAETPSKTSWEMDAEDIEPDAITDASGNIKWLNFANQEAKTMPRFTPSMGSHSFWHRGTYFFLRRKKEVVHEDFASGGGLRDEEVLSLSCFGRSTQPIKDLIEHAKEQYYFGLNKKTVIKRPSGSERRRYGGKGSWVTISERPCRPLNTVVLDEALKMEVLFDINEYLSPSTAVWYANRGIPYRRGYLLHGPPGTGKTSLTFALAGVFGLDIHVVSLLDPTMTEEELGTLFANLPGRCIVLLEDIDTAGLIKRATDDPQIKAGDEKDGKNADLSVTDLAKALTQANKISEEDKKKGITLSGLLNIIDGLFILFPFSPPLHHRFLLIIWIGQKLITCFLAGVASHEGRVLVMTTNHPEKLDEALIRDGRVDHQVAFTNATRSQIAQLFERMYTNDHPARTTFNKTIPATASSGDEKVSPPTAPKLKDGEEEELSDEHLKVLAKEFADAIPGSVFSPAEIQGFLLKRKKSPRKAVKEVGEWVEIMVDKKKGGAGGF